MSAQSPISIAIVGLGRAGWQLHLDPILEHSGFSLVAAADPEEERCRAAADRTGCKTFSGIDDLLAGSDAEVVVIATPSSTHYSDSRKVLAAGRHCVLEKPMAMHAWEAEELVRMARSCGRQLFVNHAHLYRSSNQNPEFYHLRQVIERGILGPLHHIRTFWASYSRRWDWQTLLKNGGGQLNNTCPHVLSIVLPLLGSRVNRVYADLQHIKDAGDAEDHAHLILGTESGMSVDIFVSSAVAGKNIPKWLLCGRYGTLTGNGVSSTLRYYDPKLAAPITAVDAAAPGGVYCSEVLPWVEEAVTLTDYPLPTLYEDVAAVLTTGAKPLVSPESAAEVVRVCEMARTAAACAREDHFPPPLPITSTSSL